MSVLGFGVGFYSRGPLLCVFGLLVEGVWFRVLGLS